MSLEVTFRWIAAFFIVATIFHATAFIAPAIGIPGAQWRHGVFVIAYACCAWLMLRRPRWLVIPFSGLAFFVIYIHGKRLFIEWEQDHQVTGLTLIHVAIILGLLNIIRLLIAARQQQTLSDQKLITASRLESSCDDTRLN